MLLSRKLQTVFPLISEVIDSLNEENVKSCIMVPVIIAALFQYLLGVGTLLGTRFVLSQLVFPALPGVGIMFLPMSHTRKLTFNPLSRMQPKSVGARPR